MTAKAARKTFATPSIWSRVIRIPECCCSMRIFKTRNISRHGPALAVLEEHIAGGGRPYVLARYAQLAARMKDQEGAAEAFARAGDASLRLHLADQLIGR